ncbi:hypothetical protein HSX11_08910 [Oxalobacteraceae bacterium]|nr:hypothetical protein [Oxalobacteraceae bacterium]
MRTWIKVSLLTVLAFGVCWGGAIWYWRANNRVPATSDLLLLLIVLPLALLLAIWLGSKLLAVLTAAPAVAAATPGAAVPEPAPKAGPVLTVVASALRAPHGESAQELSEAIAASKARADLDPELFDGEGFPVMSMRVSEAGEVRQEEVMSDWLREQDMGQLRFSPEQWRALALGSAVVAELAGQAASHALLEEGEVPPGSPRKPSVLPVLQLLPVFPLDWNSQQRHAASQWFVRILTEAGWPANRIAASTDSIDVSAPALLGRLAQFQQREGAPCLALLLACASQIGDESISHLAARGTLFSATNPDGQIPGEGAAGLLLADALQASHLVSADQMELHGLQEGLRNSSADDGKRASSALLGELIAQTLSGGKQDAAEVTMLVADSGPRNSRVMELMGVASAALPQLDHGADVIAAGVGSGSSGPLAFFTALALAQHEATSRAGPVLCVSNEDPYRRYSVLLKPALAV